MSSLLRLLKFGFEPKFSGSPRMKTRVRLQGALALLKLSTVDIYSKIISVNFVTLAIVTQVFCIWAVTSHPLD